MDIRDRVKSLVSQGMSYRRVASELGISSGTVSNIVNNKFEYVDKKAIRRSEVIRLRKSGIKINDIANKTGLCLDTIFNYLRGLNIKVKHESISCMDDVRLLVKRGLLPWQISIKLGIDIKTVYFYTSKLGLKSNKLSEVNKQNKQMCISLKMDGYTTDQICEITGLNEYKVLEYNGMTKAPKSLPKPKTTPIAIKKTIKRKPKAKTAKPTQIEQRAMLGRGVEAGVYTTEVVMREDRDQGRLVNLIYSDIDDTPRVPISIRVRDTSISDEEAVERWKFKFKKKSVKLVK